ncbi:MAG: hypothetical protein CMM31_05880, partial [Rhodospirillaceae bacterium]|nr:hypothetical protein [Rhodospirillaceae bacterium]
DRPNLPVTDFYPFIIKSYGALNRIMMSRNHFAVPTHHVNPIDIKELEQIHMICRIGVAIPTYHDLL